jgi:dynein heavy chain
MSCFFEEYKDTEIRIITPEEIEDLETCIENLYIYAVTWSIGTTCTLEGRKKFNNQIKEMIEQRDMAYPFPTEKTVYDWKFDITTKEYI